MHAYGPKVLGVWKGCLNPEKFLKPDPEMSKKGENRYVDANPIINMVVENPKLKEGETKRMHLMLGETPDKDRLV
ncbi:hypothetical protein KAW11_04420 [Candidatus Bathyarchaeota archaeon]|nr:hypothetical protein [Candidatus Bathyarchaeota archaeon]